MRVCCLLLQVTIVCWMSRFVVNGFQTSRLFFQRMYEREQRENKSKLYDINEWRDIWEEGMEDPKTFEPESKGVTLNLDMPLKSISILPFPFQDALMMGETKELHLHEERFLQLFAYAMERHGGIVGMGLYVQETTASPEELDRMAESGMQPQVFASLLSTMPLVELESYTKMPDNSIKVTIRAVGRAQVVKVHDPKELKETQGILFPLGICQELVDKVPPLDSNSYKLCHEFANSISECIQHLDTIETKLEKFQKDLPLSPEAKQRIKEIKERVELEKNRSRLEKVFDKETTIGQADSFSSTSSEEQQQQQQQQQKKDFLKDLKVIDKKDLEKPLNRVQRFERALSTVMQHDTQGYTIKGEIPESFVNDADYNRTLAELAATSWAAFMSETNLLHENFIPVEKFSAFLLMELQQLASARLQSLDERCLYDRLQFAHSFLTEKRSLKEKKLNQVIRKLAGEDVGDDEEEPRAIQIDLI